MINKINQNDGATGTVILINWSHLFKKKRPGKDPARLKVTTKSKPAYEIL